MIQTFSHIHNALVLSDVLQSYSIVHIRSKYYQHFDELVFHELIIHCIHFIYYGNINKQN